MLFGSTEYCCLCTECSVNYNTTFSLLAYEYSFLAYVVLPRTSLLKCTVCCVFTGWEINVMTWHKERGTCREYRTCFEKKDALVFYILYKIFFFFFFNFPWNILMYFKIQEFVQYGTFAKLFCQYIFLWRDADNIKMGIRFLSLKQRNNPPSTKIWNI